MSYWLRLYRPAAADAVAIEFGFQSLTRSKNYAIRKIFHFQQNQRLSS